MSKPDNPELFGPLSEAGDNPHGTRVTLRDLFAAAALASLGVRSALQDIVENLETRSEDGLAAAQDQARYVSAACGLVADAMLRERERKPAEPTPGDEEGPR